MRGDQEVRGVTARPVMDRVAYDPVVTSVVLLAVRDRPPDADEELVPG